MRRLAFVAPILFLISSTMAQQPVEIGGIEGGVTIRGGVQPIAGVRVTLSNGTPRGSTSTTEAPTVWTDGYGRFAFAQLRPGTYHLVFSRNGYVRQELSRSLFGGQDMAVTVAAGQTVRVAMQMMPTAVVSGRIHTVTGMPFVGVAVDILRQTYNAEGQKSLQRVGSARTNDRGEYRLFYITPGRYIVSAGAAPPAPNQLDPGSSPNAFSLPFGLTYYPAAADPTQAIPLDLSPGAELSGIDIGVQSRTHSIRGSISDNTNGAARLAGLGVWRSAATGAFTTFSDAAAQLSRTYNATTGNF